MDFDAGTDNTREDVTNDPTSGCLVVEKSLSGVNAPTQVGFGS